MKMMNINNPNFPHQLKLAYSTKHYQSFSLQSTSLKRDYNSSLLYYSSQYVR